jgi:phage terminase large subunit
MNVPAISSAASASLVPAGFDWKNPDYNPIYVERARRLTWIRANPAALPAIKTRYKLHPWEFINDWGMTFDPRNAGTLIPTTLPFLLFDQQVEWIKFILDRWKAKEPGLTEKTRDMGISWTAIALACTLCLFYDGMVVGFGSNLVDNVDKIGDPDTLFWKARFFMNALPIEFRGGWSEVKHAPYMRISFPETGSYINGEGGENIGRSGRAAIYFVDEAAHLKQPQAVEASLSGTTDSRQDISSIKGRGNLFAQKRFSGRVKVFSYHWWSDPRKDAAWYAKKKGELDPVTFAQEIDIDYMASIEGVMIPGTWIRAAVNAHVKLQLPITGQRSGALDVADEGKDKNAFCGAHGILVMFVKEWSGKGDDIFATTQEAFALCDQHQLEGFKYDGDGLGAGVRGDARVIAELRQSQGLRKIEVEAFRGSAGVFDPEGQHVEGRKNKDFFANCKAQSWWDLRTRFQTTYRALTEAIPYSPDDIISLDPNMPNLEQLIGELAQPTYSFNGVGKVVVDKTPEGAKSPNLADAVMIKYSRASRQPMMISSAALRKI